MWTLERLAKIPHVAPSFADTVTSAMRQLHHASNSVGRNVILSRSDTWR